MPRLARTWPMRSSSMISSRRARRVGAVEVGAGFEDRHDVVGDRQAPEHRGFLRQVADAELRAAVDRQARDVVVVEHDAPGIRRHEADDHVERRGLAGAVRPEQPHDLAAGHAQRQVRDDLARLVGLRKVLGAQFLHGVAPSSRGRIVMRTRSVWPGWVSACTRCSRTL
jgi:hypothetical protein